MIVWMLMLLITMAMAGDERNDGAILASMTWCTPTKAMLPTSVQMFRMQRCRTSLDRLYARHVDRWHALLVRAKVATRDDYNQLAGGAQQESTRLLQSLYKIYLLRYWIDREMSELQRLDRLWPREPNDLYEQHLVDASGVKRIMEFEPNGNGEDDDDDDDDGGEATIDGQEDMLAEKVANI